MLLSLGGVSSGISAAAYLVGMAVLVVALVMWSETLDRRFVPVPLPTPAPAATVPPSSAVTAPVPFREEIRRRSLAHVWADFHQSGWFGPLEAIFISVLAAACGVTAGLGLIRLPDHYRCGPPLTSIRVVFRAITACLGPAILTIACVGAFFVFVTHLSIELGWTYVRAVLSVEPIVGLVCLVAGTSLWILASTGIAVRAAPSVEPELPPPRCESCGYDLTHAPAEGRCPECGADIAPAVNPASKRRASPWEADPGPKSFLGGSWRILTRPSGFYGQLALRTSLQSAIRFHRLHIALFGVGAAAWIMCVGAARTIRSGLAHVGTEFFTQAPLALLVLIPLVAWLAHRGLSALVFVHWITRRELPDYRWAAKAFRFEIVFLWVLAAHTALFLGSYIVWDDWISTLLPALRRGWGRGEPEVAVLVGGNVALAIVWLIRHALILRQLRWSNA